MLLIRLHDKYELIPYTYVWIRVDDDILSKATAKFFKTPHCFKDKTMINIDKTKGTKLQGAFL